ncbi:RIP metalloprotease RseP [Sphingomonas flavalba]|uniref:RIP metalloprotease RseP n=1 Tax=Sphingomonas flavalba TaxID=2559804 RepID=UPI00109DC093|nr:RIP metalloprotease RseP [Sphingomonas flavalba]
MTQYPGLFSTAIAFLLVIGPLIFLHELGHYLVGRWFGVRADAFSIGFGREIFGITDRRGTRWKFGWLPLGGYVRFAGDMNPASQPSAEWLALPAEERNQTFQSKSVWQRAAIVAAGPIANFLIALVILGGFAVAHGEPRTPAVVDQVVAQSAADRAGLRAGDRVLSVNGRAVDTFGDLARYVVARPDEQVSLDVAREGATLNLPLAIGARIERDRFGNEYRLGVLGVRSAQPVIVPVSLIEAPVVAFRQTGAILRMMVDGLGQIITGRRPVSEMGGPLKIAQISGEQMAGGLTAFVGFIAIISINLGFINLLPVPMLDGGHLFFYALEAIRRRPVEARVQEWAYRSGLLVLLSLMLLVTFNDLSSFGLWRGLAGLIG